MSTQGGGISRWNLSEKKILLIIKMVATFTKEKRTLHLD